VSESPPQFDRLAEIADQVRDGWVRGRGPLTGLKPLIAARQEAIALEAPEDYLAILDEVIVAARSIAAGSSMMYRRDAPETLERAIARLRALCQDRAA